MNADQRRETLRERIDASLQRAQARSRALSRSHGWFVWSHFLVVSLSTALALLATVVGQAGIFHLFTAAAATPSSPEINNQHWKEICGLVSAFNVVALFLANAPRTLLLLDRLSQALASEGYLRRQRASLQIFHHDPTEVEKEYLALLATDPQIEAGEKSLPN
jgi:hypothetical protein